MKRYSALFLTRAALIAALYVALSLLSVQLGLCSGVIQCRFSEALTILPAFLPESIPGLFIGCLLTNIISGGNPWDIAFGSVATLLGAIGTYLIGRAVRKAAKKPFESRPVLRIVVLTAMFSVSPIVANALIIPPILKFAYGVEDAMWFLTVTVAAGEIIACGVFGGILLAALLKNPYTRKLLFLSDRKSTPAEKEVPAEAAVEVIRACYPKEQINEKIMDYRR